MPGLKRCARCGAMMNLSAVAVEPPRASRWTVIRWVAQIFYSLSSALRLVTQPIDNVRRVLGRSWSSTIVALLASVVPGGGQYVQGERSLARAVLGLWMICLLLAIALVQSTAGMFLMMVALLVHALAIALVLRGSLWYRSIVMRLVVGVVIVTVLQAGLYAPIHRQFAQCVFGAFRIERMSVASAVSRGDVLLHTGRWTAKQVTVGDLVVYRIDPRNSNAVMVTRGVNLDRVIAKAGDEVSVKDGVVSVNGRALVRNQGPINDVKWLGDLDFTVYPDCVGVLPSALSMQYHGAIPRDQIAKMLIWVSNVKQEQEIGVVVWRLRPFSRFGKVE